MQRTVFPAFHYALKPGGFLCLGASESIGSFTELFEPIDKKHKLYARKSGAHIGFQLPRKKASGDERASAARAARSARMPASQGELVDPARHELTAQREADRVSANQFAPPAVLINADLQILQFRGPTGAYLEAPTGKATLDVLKMARSGLMLPLRAAINQAKKDNKTVRKDNVRVEHDGAIRTVSVQVIPLKNLRERSFLVVFDAGTPAAAGAPATLARNRRRGGKSIDAKAGRTDRADQSRRIGELEAELAEMRDYQQGLQEQHEAANEELQASNEEVQSANEELQSINEELETSKEEMESANEELTTVNEEMASRNAELNRLNSDLVNIQTSTQQALVLLDRNLTIRRFSAQAEKQFNLLAADVGRTFGSVRHNLNVSDLDGFITEVIDSVRASEREVQDKDGRWFSLRVRPYLTLDNKVDGAVLVLVDISDLKRKELSIAAARDYAQAILRTARDPLLILHADLRVDTANDAFYDTFKVSPTESEGRLLYELGNHQWDIPRLRELLEGILPRNRAFDDFEVTHDFDTNRLDEETFILERVRQSEVVAPFDTVRRRKDGTLFDASVTVSPVRDKLGHVVGAAKIARDITARKRSEEALREADRHKNEFLAMLAHELRNPLAPILVSVEIIRQAQRLDESERLGDDAPKPDVHGHAPRVDHAVDVLQRQTGQMVRLVEDLLDAGRISSGKIDLRREHVELSSVVHHAVDAARPLTERRDQELTVVLPPTSVYVDADPTRLAQIVGNLLNNASKFTERAGHIWLTVEEAVDSRPGHVEGTSHQSLPQVVIRVRDTGVGIAADRLSGIFDMFTQIDRSLERSVAGLGIGLTLVKTLAEMHGGTVEATSPGVGYGSEFVVRLPIIVDAPTPAATPSLPQPAATPLRILVVDDNRDSADMLAILLKFGGHETHTAHDGMTAVEEADRLDPDVDRTGHRVAWSQRL